MTNLREILKREASLSGEKTEAPLFIAPGAIWLEPSREAMEKLGFCGDEILVSSKRLAALSIEVAERAGFANLALPFRMTVESEDYGGERIAVHGTGYQCPLSKIDEWQSLRPPDFSKGNFALAIDTISELRRLRPHAPIIADLVGPLSLATSLVDPRLILKAMGGEGSPSSREALHDMLGFLLRNSLEYLRKQADAGADVVSILDPAATLEVMGPSLFKDFSIDYLNGIINAARDLGLPAMVHLCGTHICGEGERVGGAIEGLKADAIGFDSFSPALVAAIRSLGVKVVGTIDASLFEGWEGGEVPDELLRSARALVEAGVELVSPTCRLSAEASFSRLAAVSKALN